jgi:O-acetyl-ADP-ribose deacetylase (regulator of RNase III)
MEMKMMELTCGNILKADTEAVVNAVNCVGVMGKGLALQFKKVFPDNFKAYEAACRQKTIKPGRMFVFETGNIFNPRYIVNFPTKSHWRDRSRYEDIASGLKALVTEAQHRNIHTIAIPPLGCGLGGLDWENVRAIIEEAFAGAPDVYVKLFEPTASPKASGMPLGSVTTHENSPNLSIS